MVLKNQTQFLIGGLIIIALFIGLVLCDIVTNGRDHEKIASYHLRVSGKVKKKKEFTAGHDYGYVQIDAVDFSSLQNLKEVEGLYKINGRKCVLAVANISLIEVGDSISVHNSTYEVYRKNEKVLDNNLILLSSIYTQELTID